MTRWRCGEATALSINNAARHGWPHIADAGKYYSSLKQMLGIQLVTWNDYEEGSEIESGIDNCVTVSATVAGTVASWSITGQMNTVDHFTVFASQDGANLMWLADLPTTTSSLDLASFGLNAGNYTIFVKAVGKPTLTNKMSGGVQLTIPNQPPTAALSITNVIDEKFRDGISDRACEHHRFYGSIN